MIQKILAGCLLTLCCCFYATAQQSAFTKAVYISGNDTLPYRLMYPANYNASKRYPLVVFLHGDGQRGTDNEKQLVSVPQVLTDSLGRIRYPCFVLAPQCPLKNVWAKFPGFPQSLQTSELPTIPGRQTLELIEKLLTSLPLDKRRVYITGYSGGGEGAFDLLTRKPKLFAAAVPVCSVSDTSKAYLIRKIPVWAFHGDNDQVNNVKYSRLMITALKQQGSSPKYTEYAGLGHNIWAKAYARPGLFEWLFAQKR